MTVQQNLGCMHSLSNFSGKVSSRSFVKALSTLESEKGCDLEGGGFVPLQNVTHLQHVIHHILLVEQTDLLKVLHSSYELSMICTHDAAPNNRYELTDMSCDFAAGSTE